MADNGALPEMPGTFKPLEEQAAREAAWAAASPETRAALLEQQAAIPISPPANPNTGAAYLVYSVALGSPGSTLFCTITAPSCIVVGILLDRCTGR